MKVLVFLMMVTVAFAEPKFPENFATEKLVAWCIVPFDAKKRGPEERAKMLVDLGIKRCAYDWREEHVAQFEAEILAYKTYGIEFFAFWGEHEAAFALFEKYGLHPQIWQTAPSPAGENQEEKVAAAVAELKPLAERTKAMGCKLGLYNHGGWGGEVANMVAVCEGLKSAGCDNVGIVYNFHHGHGDVADFGERYLLMEEHLLCVNLNGMGDEKTEKILSIGEGRDEEGMIQILMNRYKGPVGILDHMPEVDAAVSLRKNRDGLEKMVLD